MYDDDCLAIHHGVESALHELDEVTEMKTSPSRDLDIHLLEVSAAQQWCTSLGHVSK